MPQINYADLCITEGDQIASYGPEGWKCKRIFVADWVSNVDPTKTLYSCYLSGNIAPNAITDLPIRGAPHPTIVITNEWSDYNASTEPPITETNNAFCADLFTLKAITSTQVRVEVEYAVLTAKTQEPSDLGNLAPGLLDIGSSVQAGSTSVDAIGQPIAFCYDAGDGAGDHESGDWAITPANGGTITYVPYTGGTAPIDPFGDNAFDPGTPNISSAASIQVPSTLIRFERRETVPMSRTGWVGFINSQIWIINDVEYPPASILCTRIENKTNDNGVSYVVTYEFQQAPLKPVAQPGTIPIYPSNIQTPFGPDGLKYISAWDVGGYYVIPSGSGKYTSTSPGAAPYIPAGQVPPDCSAFIFRIYGSTDFCDPDTGLHLTPYTTPVE